MKNLIYQFWDTQAQPEHKRIKGLPSGVQASVDSMKKYADTIGAEHLFELDPPYLHDHAHKAYYGAVNPIFREEFHEYDNVLFTDADVFAVDGLKENIFENFTGDIGMAQEIFEPMLQIVENRIFGKEAFEAWGKLVEKTYSIKLPRNEKNLLKVYNSGVVLLSQKGMKKAKESFIPFKHYIDTITQSPAVKNFFGADQHYIHTSMFKANLEFVELDYGWNTKVNYYNKDKSKILFDKNKNTKLVHVQLRGKRWQNNAETLWKVVNLPVDQWGMGMIDITEKERHKLL